MFADLSINTKEDMKIKKMVFNAYKPGKDVNLSQEQLDFYNREGYLVVEGLFSPAECDEITEKVARHATKEYACILNMHRKSKLAQQDPREKTPEILREIEETSELTLNLMKERRIVSVLDQLQEQTMREYGRSATGLIEKFISREHLGLMSMILFKKPETQYASQAWNVHQDNAYTKNPHGLYITAGIFLEDVDKENGPIFVYPGSHKEGILPFIPQLSYREGKGEQPGNIAQIPEKYKGTELDVLGKKGAVMFMSGNTLHGSRPNRSKTRARPIYTNTYIPNGEEFLPGSTASRVPIPLSE